MSNLDEERLFVGPRKRNYDIAFGFVFFFLLFSSLFFMVLTFTSVLSSPAELARSLYAIEYLGMITGAIFVPMLLLFRYRRSLYLHPVYETSPRGEYKKPTPHKCAFCGRHPVSKRYHIRKIHQIKEGAIDLHYVNCGCKYCLEPIPYAMGVGV